jgi:hypothetical protein
VIGLLSLTESGGRSTDDVGSRFRVFEINDLEMVDQNSASWNRTADWLRRIEALRHKVRAST